MAAEAIFGFRREPVLITAVVRAGILLGTAFGLKLSVDQITAVMLFTEAVLALFTRSQVTSEATLQRAQTSSVEMAALAKASTGIGVALLCVVLSGATLPACASRAAAPVSPDVAALTVGADILNVTADFQTLVNDYARVHGTSAVTDQMRGVIGADVLPAARRVRDLVVSYHALSDPILKASKAAEIESALQTLLMTYAEVAQSAEVSELATQFNTASMRVRALVAQIRAEILRAKR